MDGKVVPTWNYVSVHFTGELRVHHDPEWLRDVVTRLTTRHEAGRAQPWAVTDAPARYVDGQLRAIVGVELVVERIEAKRKLSQNRSEADRRGVLAGLQEDGVHGVTELMADQLVELEAAPGSASPTSADPR